MAGPGEHAGRRLPTADVTNTANADKVPRTELATGEEVPMRRAIPGVPTVCATVAVVAVMLSLTACGDDEPKATAASPSPSAEVTPSPVPTPKQTPRPLSTFEGRPQVEALRAWAAAYAKAINAGDTSYPTMRPLMTDAGFRGLVEYIAPDDEGLHYPGPVPFTPTAVNATSRTARVPACTWVQGWAQDPATGKPARPKQIAPSYFTLQREAGRWRISGFYITKGNECATTTVKGVRW
jgi:hypothetical protein